MSALVNRTQASAARRAAPSSGRAHFAVARAVATEVKETAAVAAPAKIKPLTWDADTETPKDVMAFAGPAPERANGRAAMLGFAAMALSEASSHTPALETLSSSLPSVVIVSLLLSVATVMPKIVSGSPLAELHAAASGENLKGEGVAGQALALFDTNLELWSGRLAMLGVLGLPIVEVFKGDSLF